MDLTIYNKKRVIRGSNISVNTQDEFEGIYQGHTIRIDKQKRGNFYAWVTHPDGTYIVDGYFDHSFIGYVIDECMENILWNERDGAILEKDKS